MLLKINSSLRGRIVAASLAMTFMTCLLFATGIFIAFEFDEEVLFEGHLEADQATFIKYYEAVPEIASVPADNFDVYITDDGDKSLFPDFLRDLPPEDDDIVVDGKALEIEIVESNGKTFFFVTEETATEDFETFLLISAVIIIILICLGAAVLGDTLARHIIKPLTQLADEVNHIGTSPGSGGVQKTEGKDELEVLSQAVDAYQARVNELLSREREFSSDVSHELRTPLMGIQAAAENLQMNKGDEGRVLELARRIEARCRQMKSLVESMLYLARDPASLENDFSKISVRDIIADQLDVTAPFIESKGIVIRVIEHDNPEIYSSPAILSVIFGNLLRNAVQHSESSEIQVELNTGGFTIRDFGRGMPAELMNRMTGRRDGAGSGLGKGNGIGLLLVKRLCDHFSWHLAVDSGEGRGTRITVNFS